MTRIKASPQAYMRAIDILKSGGLVVLPTETVYGLAALASSDTAIERIYTAKGRAFTKPLSIGVWAKPMLTDIAGQNPMSIDLINQFWPGPLTLVCPMKENTTISPLCNQNTNTIGMRHPDTPWVNTFTKAGFFEPIALTSANISGQKSPTTAQEATEQLGDQIDLIIDDGPCAIGVASTVLAMNRHGATVLREGGLEPEALAPYHLDFPA